jgi:hypothetical protein
MEIALVMRDEGVPILGGDEADAALLQGYLSSVKRFPPAAFLDPEQFAEFMTMLRRRRITAAMDVDVSNKGEPVATSSKIRKA